MIYILDRILAITEEERPQAVLIAGDVYDKAYPPVEGVELLDEFLYRLTRMDLEVFLLSGNHDSSERLAFGGRFMEGSGLHISPAYRGEVEPFEMKDEFGSVLIYMLPFIRPARVQHCFPEEKIESYTDAVRVAISHMPLPDKTRKIILSHQYITGSERSDSEIIPIGGLDAVDSSVYDPFDYVALGHLHRPQNVGGQSRIRYCGTPLKYSFSEMRDAKSVSVLEMDGEGALSLRMVPLVPLRDLKEIRGSFEELTKPSFYAGSSYGSDYMRIILTDEEEVPEAAAKLHLIYPNLMKLEYDNQRTRHFGNPDELERSEALHPMEVFEAFYEEQNGLPFSGEQRRYMTQVIQKIWEEEA